MVALWTWTDGVEVTANAGSPTTPALNIGTPSADRIVVAFISVSNNSVTNVNCNTSPVVALNSTTPSSAGPQLTAWWGYVPNSTSATFTFGVSFTGFYFFQVGIVTGAGTTVLAPYDAQLGTPNWTISLSPSNTFNIPAGGVGAIAFRSDQNPTRTWSTAIEDQNIGSGTAFQTVAHTTTSGNPHTENLTLGSGSPTNANVSISFGPAPAVGPQVVGWAESQW
jgi:hypothetical protein